MLSFNQNQTADTAFCIVDREMILPGLLFVAALFLGTPSSLAQNPEPLSQEWADTAAADERSLRAAISEIESRDGAYAAGLPEQILSLGLALQQQDRHPEAQALFKRGVHLARINNGLYSPEQIPLLQGEIKSALALGDYAKVDELQQYLYRVQDRGMPAGEARANALVQQANWHFNAYQLRVGTSGPERLLNMWDLYRAAWDDLRSIEGNSSPKLLRPLYGLLRTQYLISEYHASSDGSSSSFNSGYGSINANRFYAHRSQNFDLGESVIQSIYNIQRESHGPNSPEATQALVSLGDWQMWYGKREEATETYRLAIAELAQRDDAQEEAAQMLAEPVPLPDMKGLRGLPAPVSAEQGNILVEFGVNSRGKVVDLTRLDDNEDLDASAIRLMRVLRGTKFRPRFEAGEPVETDKLVWAYEIDPNK